RGWWRASAGPARAAAPAGRRVARRASAGARVAPPAEAPPTAADRMRWTALAAVPSGLVIAVTSFVTTEVAAAPFLWVIPLAMYLATFVAVVCERPGFAHAAGGGVLPAGVAALPGTLLPLVQPGVA